MKETAIQKIVLLDASIPGEQAPLRALLIEVLQQSGATVQVFSLSTLKLAHCIGCFGCWVETPGRCRYQEPDGQAIVQAIIENDTTVLFTPVVFGGYSSCLKQMVDRFLPLILPYMRCYHQEVHHVPRYAHFPRLVVLGVQPCLQTETAELFKLLVGRNALNFHTPSYAVEVISQTDDPTSLRQVFQLALHRHDRFPGRAAIKALRPIPEVVTSSAPLKDSPHACLIVGSPKTLSPSTSNVLGTALLDRLKEQGWETEALTLKVNLCTPAGQATLLAAVDRADLLLFAFPLYIDALPFLMTKALEVISAHRQAQEHPRALRLVAIANNGFAEAYQNHLALSICQHFAAQTAMTWAGGLAMGAGEALCSGQQLQPRMASGLPAAHVIRALDAAGAALARGEVVPVEAITEMAATPIPYTPLAIWRRLFVLLGNQWWQQRAARHQVSKQGIRAQPYLRVVS